MCGGVLCVCGHAVCMCGRAVDLHMPPLYYIPVCKYRAFVLLVLV